MKCPKCEGMVGITATNSRRPMRGASEYQLKCPCGHEWKACKGHRFGVSRERNKEIFGEWDNVEIMPSPLKQRTRDEGHLLGRIRG
jgi:hypothetical protein